MSKIKIAVLGTRGFPSVQGGVEAHCQNLYPRLVKLGCEVTVFGRAPYLKNCEIASLPSVARNDEGGCFYQGVKIVPLTCPKNKFLEAFVHTFRGILAARNIKPDILHIHAVGPSLLIPLARLLGFNVVMTNHGPDYERKKWNKAAKFILRMGERCGSKYANAIITVSETAANNIKIKYGRDVNIIPNGVTIPDIQKSDDALKKYNLEKRRYILAVGRFVPEKGFLDLVETFGEIGTVMDSRLRGNDNERWKLVIAGDADHEDGYSRELKNKAKENKNIVLAGFLTGKPLQELFSHAGLFVLPSYYEGLPIALLEAMSYGLSCVVSDIPANREVPLSSDRFFRPGDIKGILAKIEEFIARPFSDEEKRRQIAMVAERYDWDKIASKILEVYKSVVPQ